MSLQEFLPLVEKPSRYLGTEKNRIRKDLQKIKLHIGLAFPDLYEIGTSHFGLQVLYTILNHEERIAAERVYAPAPDLEQHLRKAGLPLMSLETRTPLARFDMLGFSLLYELNYTNILQILDLAGIPFLAADRDETWPLVIAGGPCTVNPEPVADFFDAMVVGDGEEVILEMSRVLMEWQKDGRGDKEELLRVWSGLEGVYVPSFFRPRYTDSGLQVLEPKHAAYQKVVRRVLPDLDGAPFAEAPLVPFGRPVHDRLRLEVARGCTRGCRFCQAGMIYRPVRERSISRLLDLTEKSLAATGYEDLSLLSLSTGDYSCIVPLMEHLMARLESRRVAVSLPSLRAGTLSPRLMELIQKVRKTGFTIAPEAGSQRLRDRINKNITEDEIITTVESAYQLGWQVIKLYFMIGFPGETQADLEAIPELVNRIRKIRRAGRPGRNGRFKLNVSFTTLIPKAHTPFQWAPQIPVAESAAKLSFLKARLKSPGIQLKWQAPTVSLLEGLWARGDRRLSALLITAYRLGCRFDGWTDSFDAGRWQQACETAGIDSDFYTAREREKNEPLPWDHIDCRVNKEFLRQEFLKGENGETTTDCRQGSCQQCGVCDFVHLKPRTWQGREGEDPSAWSSQPTDPPPFITMHGVFSKRGNARFFSHLEVMKIFLRAFRRADIVIEHSQGFHPLPKLSFCDPLPIGMESQRESFYASVAASTAPAELVVRLNAELPEGLTLTGCQVVDRQAAQPAPTSAIYEVDLKEKTFDPLALAGFWDQAETTLERTTKKGKLKKIDLKDKIISMELVAPSRVRVELKVDKEAMVRPLDIIRLVFQLSEVDLKTATVLKCI